ncbi:MAG: hypothetical protein R6V50_08100 [Thermoplasmatota archaeon]
MGFSLTGAHVIFFIASVIVAGAVSGVFVASTIDISSSLSERANRIQEILAIDFKIINDPKNIPLLDQGEDSSYMFYLRNIGGKKLDTTVENFQIFINGQLISTINYNFVDASIKPSEYTTILISINVISSGDHILRVVGPFAIEDIFIFTIP